MALMSLGITREETQGADGPHQRVRTSARRAGWVVTFSLLVVVCAVVWTTFDTRRAQPSAGRLKGVRLLGIDRPFPAGGRFAADPFIGSRVCAECHPGETALH